MVLVPTLALANGDSRPLGEVRLELGLGVYELLKLDLTVTALAPLELEGEAQSDILNSSLSGRVGYEFAKSAEREPDGYGFSTVGVAWAGYRAVSNFGLLSSSSDFGIDTLASVAWTWWCSAHLGVVLPGRRPPHLQRQFRRGVLKRGWFQLGSGVR